MNHFYAEIQGSHGRATRQGTRNSGINGHIRGWDVGVAVDGSHDSRSGEDVFSVFVTTGSSGGGYGQRLIATIRRKPDDQTPRLELAPRSE